MLIQKQFSIKWLTVVLMMCLMCGLSSCKSDGDDDDPTLPYIGTWERTESSGEESINQELVITETTFIVTMSMTVDDEWVDMMLIKGTYSVSNNIFMLTITQFGILMEEGGEMIYFIPSDLEWDELLEDELEIEDHFEAKFVVNGNQLNLIVDENGDGLFDPIMEGETYTKK